jgi:hypothetical protein
MIKTTLISKQTPSVVLNVPLVSGTLPPTSHACLVRTFPINVSPFPRLLTHALLVAMALSCQSMAYNASISPTVFTSVQFTLLPMSALNAIVVSTSTTMLVLSLLPLEIASSTPETSLAHPALLATISQTPPHVSLLLRPTVSLIPLSLPVPVVDLVWDY